MTPFRVTFGQQYAREEHPWWPPAHPDGWLTIMSGSYHLARAAAGRLLRGAWCDLYEPGRWGEIAHLFPRGELAVMNAADILAQPAPEPLGKLDQVDAGKIRGVADTAVAFSASALQTAAIEDPEAAGLLLDLAEQACQMAAAARRVANWIVEHRP